MTPAELEERLRYWQGVLRLRDWKVQLVVERIHEMRDEERERTLHGFIEQLPEERLAKIHLLDPDDYPPTCWTPDDLETTLVHELLHLYFKPLEPEEKSAVYRIAEEQAINAMAEALTTLDRRQPSDPAA